MFALPEDVLVLIRVSARLMLLANSVGSHQYVKMHLWELEKLQKTGALSCTTNGSEEFANSIQIRAIFHAKK